ncbi:MAG: Ig-like domain-containing protein, partial [Psychrosphaera sp.]|nr:Ig-like domain-containing protein [Psychrosphaera sp.]
MIQSNANGARSDAYNGFGFDFNLETLLSMVGISNPQSGVKVTLHAGEANVNRTTKADELTVYALYKDVPIAFADTITLLKGQSSHALPLTDNDINIEATGPSPQTLTPINTTDPAYGALTTANNRLVYTPANGSTAQQDSFYYKVADRLGQQSAPVKVTLNLRRLLVKDDTLWANWEKLDTSASAAIIGGLMTQPGGVVTSATGSASPRSITLDIMANDEGEITAATRVKVTKAPSGGSVVTDAEGYAILTDGKVTYVLDETKLLEEDQFSYSLHNNGASSDPGDVNILNSLKPSNDGPYTLSSEEATFLDVTVNDSAGKFGDAGKDGLIPIIDSRPETYSGSATVGRDTDGRYKILYTPDGPAKNVTFRYKLTHEDDEDLRSLNYATVTISEVNVVPQAVSQLTVNQGHKTFDISWIPLSGFSDSYELEQNSGPNRYNDDNWATISKPPETTRHTLTNVVNDSYFFRVRACRDGGLMCGPWATSGQFTMDAPSTEPPPVALGSHETADVDSDIIGSIKGSAGISGGAASYSVPIQLPPGRAGMAPGVSLNYSSNGGNGLVGQGWSLSAGGSVSRCAATYAIDKRHDAVQYNSNDKLCLNGQRLILQSGSYGGNTSTYHPEMSPTTTVTLSGTWGDSGSAFTVMLGNGKTQYYGSNGNLILTRTAFPVPHTWLLTQTKDQHNNTIDYTYNEAAHLQGPEASSSYLTTIHYTGRGTNKGDRKVHFSYTERDDVTMGYRAGSLTVRNQRLSTITTWADDTTPAQRYNLTYQSGARKSILQNIELCFSAGTENCLPMTTFGVKGLNTVNPDDASTPISIFKATSTVARTFISTDNSAYESDFSMSADYDGDGKNDLLINDSNLTNVNVKLSGNPTELAITGLHARNK